MVSFQYNEHKPRGIAFHRVVNDVGVRRCTAWHCVAQALLLSDRKRELHRRHSSSRLVSFLSSSTSRPVSLLSSLQLLSCISSCARETASYVCARTSGFPRAIMYPLEFDHKGVSLCRCLPFTRTCSPVALQIGAPISRGVEKSPPVSELI